MNISIAAELASIASRLLTISQTLAMSHAAIPVELKPEVKKYMGRNRGEPQRSPYSGCHLRALISDNPRQEGVPGWRSMQIVLDAGPVGIAFDDFRAKGGRAQDMVWDWERSRILIQRPDGKPFKIRSREGRSTVENPSRVSHEIVFANPELPRKALLRLAVEAGVHAGTASVQVDRARRAISEGRGIDTI